MINNDVIFGTIASDDFRINERELTTRIGYPIVDNRDHINALIELIKDNASYKFAYVKIPLSINDTVCDLGFACVDSPSLCQVLCGCKEVIVLAVSTGVEVDRLISKFQVSNKADAYLCDAISSALIESVADYLCGILSNKMAITKRFSPGYADFPLEFQSQILDRLSSQSTVGISLTDSKMMIPTKSITAILGVY